MTRLLSHFCQFGGILEKKVHYEWKNCKRIKSIFCVVSVAMRRHFHTWTFNNLNAFFFSFLTQRKLFIEQIKVVFRLFSLAGAFEGYCARATLCAESTQTSTVFAFVSLAI